MVGLQNTVFARQSRNWHSAGSKRCPRQKTKSSVQCSALKHTCKWNYKSRTGRRWQRRMYSAENQHLHLSNFFYWFFQKRLDGLELEGPESFWKKSTKKYQSKLAWALPLPLALFFQFFIGGASPQWKKWEKQSQWQWQCPCQFWLLLFSKRFRPI